MDTHKSTDPKIGFISLETDDPKAMRLSARSMFKRQASLQEVFVSGPNNTEKFDRISVNTHEGRRANKKR